MPTGYSHFAQDERERLALLVQADLSLSYIARVFWKNIKVQSVER